MPIRLRDAVVQELRKMVVLGVIRLVEGPTDWCAEIVPVLKPSGQVRICIDFTHLNTSVRRERYVLPTVEETLDQLGAVAMSSKLDANSGFHQIRFSPSCQELTTFITPIGRFCFTPLPFGITSAPEYFQKRMSEVLSGLPGVLNLIDDVLVLGKGHAEHDADLHKTLKRLEQTGATLNKAKCVFSTRELTFLECIISRHGV